MSEQDDQPTAASRRDPNSAFAGLEGPEDLLPAAQLADLSALGTAELRELRSRCEVAEEGVSYARRVLQGRLDILRARLGDRDDGTDRLLSALPAILADAGHVTDPLQARATRVRVPPDAERYAAIIDAVLTEDDLDSIDEVAIADLDPVIERLAAVEQELSHRRHALFDRIDAVRAELVARYKDGRADVRELLA